MMQANTDENLKVLIVDDDEQIRRWICRLLDQVGIPYAEFSTAEEFLENFDPNARGCVLLDMRMPGMGGRVLHENLMDMGAEIPVLFMTGFGEVSVAVEALQKGAVEFIEKPMRAQDLLDRVQKALLLDTEQHAKRHQQQEHDRILDRLTPREHEVVELILKGFTNKQIAFKLSVSPQAIDARKNKAMRKLGLNSVAELVAFVMHTRDKSRGSGKTWATTKTRREEPPDPERRS
jgi:two-component system response regulator FixJ